MIRNRVVTCCCRQLPLDIRRRGKSHPESIGPRHLSKRLVLSRRPAPTSQRQSCLGGLRLIAVLNRTLRPISVTGRSLLLSPDEAMSTMSAHVYYKVGVLLFEGGDILDFTGPMEVLSHVSYNRNPDQPDRMFTFETIARNSSVRAASCLTVQADVVLKDAINDVAQYDILVIPGGPPSVVLPLTYGNPPELEIIRKFAALPQSLSEKPRVLFSVCTGAFLLGAAGVLPGLTVTTHHRAVNVLQEICDRFGKDGASTKVVQKRYIDGGLLQGSSVRVLTAGGVSSGLDASFHLVRQFSSQEMAAYISRVMEYDWTELEN